MSRRDRLLVPLLLSLACPHPARAQQARIELTWSGPAECQDDGGVEREIERIVGDSRTVAAEAPLRVLARVTRQHDGNWLVHLSTRAGERTGERSLIGTSCAEVQQATALIVALMVNPNVRLEPEPPAPSPPVAASPPRKAGAQPRAAETPSNEARLGIEPSLGAAFNLGVLPSVGMGLSFGVALRGQRWSGELSGAAWLPQSKTSDDALEAGGDFGLLGANLFACYQVHPTPLGCCLGPGVRSMRGEGFGVSTPSNARATWAVVAAELFVAAELSHHLVLRLTLGAEFPFRPPTFSLAGLGKVHSPAPVAGTAGSALAVRF